MVFSQKSQFFSHQTFSLHKNNLTYTLYVIYFLIVQSDSQIFIYSFLKIKRWLLRRAPLSLHASKNQWKLLQQINKPCVACTTDIFSAQKIKQLRDGYVQTVATYLRDKTTLFYSYILRHLVDLHSSHHNSHFSRHFFFLQTLTKK